MFSVGDLLGNVHHYDWGQRTLENHCWNCYPPPSRLHLKSWYPPTHGNNTLDKKHRSCIFEP